MERRLIELLPTLYDAALSDSMPELLDEICAACGAFGASLHVAEYDHAPAVHLATVSSGLSAFGAELQDYMSRYGAEEAKAWGLVPRKPGAFFADKELWATEEEMRARAEIQALERRFGILQRGAIRFNDTPAWGDMMGVQFQVREAAPLNRAREVTTALFPHMRTALRMIRRQNILAARERRLIAAINRLDLPVLLLDERRRVSFRNAAAETLLDADLGVSLRSDQRLELSAPEHTARLDQMIKQALETVRKEGDGGGAEFVSEDRRGGALRVIVHPFADFTVRDFDTVTGALVEIVSLDIGARFSAKHFDTLYQLTPAELSTAELMLEGRTAREIAERRDVSLETSRSQIKGALQKTNCRNRLEFALLSAAVNPPARAPDDPG